MQDRYSSPPSVVVGIDGSRSAVDAALWAVDEAVSRDIALRLVYAINPDRIAGADAHDMARQLARADVAVRDAFTAVESTCKPVKIEVEILQEPPTKALLQASREAALLCVGSIGLEHSAQGRIGSTAAVLASSARCPVAIIHGHDPFLAEQQWVVAEIDGSAASDGVIRFALEEAQLRRAQLRVVVTSQSRFADIRDNHTVADGNRLTTAHLDRRLAQWIKRYPDLDVRRDVIHGSILNFVTKNADSIQLLVAGHERAEGITALVGPPGYATLHNASCSVLICEPQTVL